MKRISLYFALITQVLFAQIDMSGQLAQMLQSNPNQLGLNTALSMNGLSNPLLSRMLQDSLMTGPKNLAGYEYNADSTLLVYKDTVLAKPGMGIDSLGNPDTSEVLETKRYDRSLFYKGASSLFSSVTSAVGYDYPIKAGDQMVLTLWGEVEKEHVITVNNQGRVNIPSVGLVSFNGLTLGEAEASLRKKLKRVYSGVARKTTKYALRFEKTSSIKVFVLGEVGKPGSYVFNGNTSALLALYFAEGPTEIGSVRNMRIVRGKDSINVDLYKFLFGGKKELGHTLVDGDVLYLPRAQSLVEILGDVGRPSVYELKAEEGIRELVQYSGGVNASVSNQGVTIHRYMDGGRYDLYNAKPVKEYLEKKSREILKDGDVVEIPKSTLEAKDFVTLLGAVKYPNTYQWKENLTLKNAIDNAGGMKNEAYLNRVQIIRPKLGGGSELLSYSMAEGSSESLVLKGKDTIIVFDQREFYEKDSVDVSGAIKHPGYYEHFENMTVKDLILMAGGTKWFSEKGVMRLERLEVGKEEVTVFNLNLGDDFEARDSKIILKPKDHLIIPVNDKFQVREVVSIRGAFLKPGNYSLKKRGETLKELLERVGLVHKKAYLGGARFFRNSNEIDILSDKKEPIKEQMAIDFLEALDDDEMHNIELVDGDSIFVPAKQVWVKVRGEVGAETNVLYKSGKNIYYYIARAGGFTPISDEERVMVTYANGEKMATDQGYEDPDPGSEIFIPKKEKSKATDWLRVAQVISSVLATLATTIATLTLLDSK